MSRLLCYVLTLVIFASTVRADEKLKDVACRSVHLSYSTPKPAGAAPKADSKAGGTVFYNEVTVEKSAEGTYFCVCGFDAGYFGIQELTKGKKVVIFSVWDPGNQNDPKSVKEEQRVQLIHKDEQVRTGRFGGEGTGGQSFLDYDWKVGETYRFAVHAKLDGNRTKFAGYFFVPEMKAWKHLVTFSTLHKGRLLGGYYSFVEDFRRNRVSATHARQAQFGNGWVRTGDQWLPIKRAQFTADNNPAMHVNAGTIASEGGMPQRFFLTTGGETKNTDTPLWKHIELKETAQVAPADVRDLLAK